MNAQTILCELKSIGVYLSVDGDDLVLKGKGKALTKDMLAVIRQHKPALIALLSSPKIADDPLPPKDAPPYIYRCPQCRGTNGGCIRVDVETLPDGQERELEVWGCLTCR